MESLAFIQLGQKSFSEMLSMIGMNLVIKDPKKNLIPLICTILPEPIKHVQVCQLWRQIDTLDALEASHCWSGTFASVILAS